MTHTTVLPKVRRCIKGKGHPIQSLIDRGALFVINHSAGKDSQDRPEDDLLTADEWDRKNKEAAK